MILISLLLGIQHEIFSLNNKPIDSPVVPLKMILNGILPSLCGRQVVGPVCMYGWLSVTEEMHTKYQYELIGMKKHHPTFILIKT